MSEYEQDEFPKKRISWRIAVLIWLGFLLTSTLAANITLNQTGRIEFGQGVYSIKACDDFIRLDLTYTSYDPAEGAVLYNGNYVPAVKSLLIDGFDAQKCKNKNFKIRILEKNASTASNLFVNGTGPTYADLVWITVSDNAAVTLKNSAGTAVGSGDIYHSISKTISTERYTVTFVTPVLPMSLVGRVTIESASNNP